MAGNQGKEKTRIKTEDKVKQVKQEVTKNRDRTLTQTQHDTNLT